MEKRIDVAIKVLAERITKDVKPDDALKLTQAASNLAHVLVINAEIKKMQKELLGLK